MAKYRVLVDSVIGSGFYKAGKVIDYDGKSEGKPGANLELVKEPVRTAKGAEDTQDRAAATAE